MDGFDKKREVVKHLLGVLKGHAVGEVEGGLKHSEPSMEKVSEKKEATPPMAMSDGGMAMASDEPENEMPSDLPSEPGAEHEVSMGEMEDEDEDNNSSSFMGLMKKVKK